MPTKLDIDEEYVITEYIDKNRLLRDIASELGCSIAPLKKIMQKRGIQKRAEKIENRKSLSEEYLLDHYIRQNKTKQQIADELGIGIYAVDGAIRSFKIKKSDFLTQETLHKMYVEEGITIRQMANLLDIDRGVIKRKLEKFDILKPEDLVLVGDKFGKISIIEEEPYKYLKTGEKCFKCQCDCGNELVTTYKNLANRIVTHCGCQDTRITKEYLQVEFIEKCRTAEDISNELGVQKAKVLKFVKIFGLDHNDKEIKHPKTFIDLTGEKFGMITVLNRVKSNKFQQTRWAVRCDCGREFEIKGSSLRSGHTKSCGCWQSVHKQYQDVGNISGAFWRSYANGARQRDIEFAITQEYANEVFILQNGRCALTGLPLVIAASDKNKKDTTASMDRIDNSLGYIEDNIQFILRDLNMMKKDYPQDRVIEICIAVAEYQKQKTQFEPFLFSM